MVNEVASGSKPGIYSEPTEIAVAGRTFEYGLRADARDSLRSRVPFARTVFTTHSKLRNVESEIRIGQTKLINVAIDPCDRVSSRTGRVAAISRNAIILADTANPNGTFSDAQYQTIAHDFDSLIYSTETEAFGQPSDIDGNGRIVIFFTSAVNELTAPHSTYVVGGFFHPRDLFPQSPTGNLTGCRGSNLAEMFYMLVPDPEGAVNGNVRSVEGARSNGMAVLAHELEHLVNSSRRLYLSSSANWPEEVWLDEGLAHIAEELVFFRASGLERKSDIDALTLKSNTTFASAAQLFQSANFRRFGAYLQASQRNSPVPADRDDDRLQTRGATWSLLRYLADHSGRDESGSWKQIVNSPLTGIENLSATFPGINSGIQEWAVANYMDNSSTRVEFNYPSWNLPSMLREFNGDHNYPFAFPVMSGATIPVSLSAGGAAYFGFSSRAGRSASVRLTATGGAVPRQVSLTVVRIR